MSKATFLFIAANEGVKWGGSEFLWSSAAEKLARRGFQVRVSAKDWGAPVHQIERLRSAGCAIFYRHAPSFLYRLGSKFFPFPAQPEKHLRSVVDGVDLVVISQGNNTEGLPWMELTRRSNRPYVVISQCASEMWTPDDHIAERLADSFEAARRSYFVSNANLELSRRQFATPLQGARVIRNPFNVRYDAHPPWPQNELEHLSLACVARLEIAAKGQDLLLEVLSFPRWRERKVHLSLIGDGVNARMLRRRADQLRLTNVEFTGFSTDIEQVWSSHHALVLPSRCEGLPLALVEAMLCGRPSIVTDVAGNGELVRDDINGFLAGAPTIPNLDAAMSRAWDARSRLRAMGAAAATDIRGTVPKDPGESFVQELLTLVDSGKSPLA